MLGGQEGDATPLRAENHATTEQSETIKDMIRLSLSTCLATASVDDVLLVFVGLEKTLLGGKPHGCVASVAANQHRGVTEGGDDVGPGEPVV
jgi:hypothetical protein